MKLMLKWLGGALLALSLLSGCGYHVVGSRGPLVADRGVNVILFANKSYRAGLEGVLARNLIDELALRSGGQVLPADQAQLELTGTITSYTTTPVSYTALDTIKEYRAVITAQVILREQQTKKVLWKGDLTEDQTFPVNANIALQQNAEEVAAARICRLLSQDIWRKLTEAY